MRIGISRALVAFAPALLAASPSIAWAQAFNALTGQGNLSSSNPLAHGGQGAPQAPKVAPPPALPGATPNADAVAPAAKSPLDMEPDDALFDAINRGDIEAARDAISRGADLHARNILGMTPMELSVDLGRNNISFLLLSLRGSDDDNGRQASLAPAAKPTPTRQAKQSAGRVLPVARSRSMASAQQPAASETARLFSGDGGSPVPSAGFLGFGSGQR